VSSILDALRKLEESAGAVSAPGSNTGRSRRRLPLAVLGIVVAFLAGLTVAAWLREPRPAPPVSAAPRVEPTPRTPPAVAAERATPPPTLVAVAKPPPPPPEPTAAAAPPPPTVASAPPPPPHPPTTPPAAPRAFAEPPRAQAFLTPPATVRRPEQPFRPSVATAPAAQPPPLRPAPEPPASAAHADEGVLPRPPANAPQVEVNFLAYSRMPARRTVTLTIDGTGMVTLHEGETAGDVEVARILADRVELRHGGQTFAVRATQ
jgi:hypothetical protein